MVDANLKIINELKSFLEIACNDAEVRKVITQSETDFSRDRTLTLPRIASLIINMPKRSLSIEIREFFDSIDKDLKPCTKGAFSLQRTKLDALFFEIWNNCLVECFYHYYGGKVKRWRGFRVQAVDGSTAYLVNYKGVSEHFGTQDNQHGSVPMARVMQVQDILNDITVWGTIRPIKQSETAIIAKQVDNFYTDSLTLFDRAYPSYALIYLMINQETPRHFAMRCKAGFNNVFIIFNITCVRDLPHFF